VLHISIWEFGGSKLSLGGYVVRVWIVCPCGSVPTPYWGGMECGWYGSVCSHMASKAHKG